MAVLRILAVGDIHVESELVKSTLSLAKNEQVGMIILTGDFCNGRTLPREATVEDFLDQMKIVAELLKNSDIPMYFVLGNHDPVELAAILSEGKLITDLHGNNVRWHNYVVGGIGGSHMVTPQLFNLSLPFMEGIFTDLIEWEEVEFIREIEQSTEIYYSYSNVPILYKKVFPCDILITHTPPLLPHDTNYRKSSTGLYQLIATYKPLLCFSGHIHKPKKPVMTLLWGKTDAKNGSETTLINLGSLENRKVALLELHTNKKSVKNIQFRII